jgi:D-alanyl-D-alanine carboxypeptidase/D-alanyl-D-alanine-endopeptidase (penicillin-binding protein 4)
MLPPGERRIFMSRVIIAQAVSAVVLFLMSTVALGQTLDTDELRAELNRILQTHETARRTTVTCKVVDLQTGRVVFEKDSGRLLVPASNLKIYTSACALDTLEPTTTFATRLVATGKCSAGHLQGDLVLVGGGNAMLTSAELLRLADRVVDELQIARIDGRVLVDNTRYASPLKGPGWMWDDDPDDYNMSITPLMVDFNVLTVRLTPQGNRVHAALAPASPFPPIQFVDQTVSEAGPRVTRAPFTETILIADRGPLEKVRETKLTMHDPGRWVAGMLQQMLTERGVQFGDGANHSEGDKCREGDERDFAELVHDGVDLATTLNHFHEESENAVGEVLLHEIAIARGVRRPRWKDAAQCVSTWLVENAGLEPGSFRYVDGSGLSRYNLISADSAVDLLSFMDQHRHARVFRDSLPKYEVDLGEIEGADGSTPSDNPGSSRVSAKSGSMTGVSTSSGYVTTLGNRQLAFSILANGFIGTAKPIHDLRAKVWRALVRYAPAE